jgi:hypothetical protein
LLDIAGLGYPAFLLCPIFYHPRPHPPPPQKKKKNKKKKAKSMVTAVTHSLFYSSYAKITRLLQGVYSYFSFTFKSFSYISLHYTCRLQLWSTKRIKSRFLVIAQNLLRYQIMRYNKKEKAYQNFLTHPNDNFE